MCDCSKHAKGMSALAEAHSLCSERESYSLGSSASYSASSRDYSTRSESVIGRIYDGGTTARDILSTGKPYGEDKEYQIGEGSIPADQLGRAA
tara:strand:+ start:1442 stop:1720 length:279 start_codon:yes stop_codon:yes gene_type:complete